MDQNFIQYELTAASKQRIEELTQTSILESLENSLLQVIMTIMQDGICFLSTDLDVLYANDAMRFWYELDDCSIGRKCYDAYHGRKEPCVGCPVLRALESGQPETGDQLYEKNKKREGWQRVFCVPIIDDLGNVIMVIEYIRDVTYEKKSSLSLDLMKGQIESLISAMEEKEQENKKKERALVGNMHKSIDAVLSYLEKILDGDSFRVVKNQLEMTTTGVAGNHEILSQLSEKELVVAKYIAKGYMSKEIADELMVTKKAIDYHRTNLRKRLGLSPQDNLKQYLKELLSEGGY